MVQKALAPYYEQLLRSHDVGLATGTREADCETLVNGPSFPKGKMPQGRGITVNLKSILPAGICRDMRFETVFLQRMTHLWT